jgi:hypothetical protein
MGDEPRVGSQAPSFEYSLPDGTRAQLAELWSDGPALLIWLRHCG